jgi:hypothetical protein
MSAVVTITTKRRFLLASQVKVSLLTFCLAPPTIEVRRMNDEDATIYGRWLRLVERR